MKEYICDLTRFLDQFLVGRTSIYGTYLLLDSEYATEVDELTAYPIRVPGATRGSVFVDSDKIIRKIEFTPNVAFIGEGALGCYSPKLKEYADAMIGDYLLAGLEVRNIT